MPVKVALVATVLIIIGVILMMQFFATVRHAQFNSMLNNTGIYQDENGDYKVEPEAPGDASKGISGDGSRREDSYGTTTNGSKGSATYRRIHR